MDDYARMYLEIRYGAGMPKLGITECIEDFCYFEKRDGRPGIVILDITEGEILTIMSNISNNFVIEDVATYEYHVIISI